ncbi:MAG: SWIM zinc finger family protein [Gemmatimonadaceae bacterium]
MEPRMDFDGAGGIDFSRLERSLALKGNRVGEGIYHFSGGAQDHWVDLYNAHHPRCDCGDHLWRERICKHILAALIREGNENVVRALGDVVERLRTTREAAA